MKNISELEERLNMILDSRYAKGVSMHKAFADVKEFILEQFKHGLGDDVDNALNAVQGLRRKIQNYVKDFPSGYEEYKEKVLRGCELIQDAHYDFLEDAHNGKYKVVEGSVKNV